MSASNSKLTLIANPKNFAERENNKAYYQEKFFSKGQKVSMKEKKRKEEAVFKEIAKRHEFGDNCLLGRNINSKSKHLSDWKYTKESLKLFHERMYINGGIETGETGDVATTPDVDEPVLIHNMTPSETVDNTIKPLSDEVVDSWEDLC